MIKTKDWVTFLDPSTESHKKKKRTEKKYWSENFTFKKIISMTVKIYNFLECLQKTE